MQFLAATPKHSVETSQEPKATLRNNKEDIVDKEDEEEEEENVKQASGGSIPPDSQGQFLTLEPIPSQDHLAVECDAVEGTSGREDIATEGNEEQDHRTWDQEHRTLEHARMSHREELHQKTCLLGGGTKCATNGSCSLPSAGIPFHCSFKLHPGAPSPQVPIISLRRLDKPEPKQCFIYCSLGTANVHLEAGMETGVQVQIQCLQNLTSSFY
ncbi:hypothetical protein UY3_07176 [Chelonia mydas]|uniref:Uncharacterized protein n=1 Tax=Chelonia mydas TaxID=8469 RepID=M7BEN6_CHEMY|nr:hypothetical protein UY3_07176 [Chelonia mydas]